MKLNNSPVKEGSRRKSLRISKLIEIQALQNICTNYDCNDSVKSEKTAIKSEKESSFLDIKPSEKGDPMELALVDKETRVRRSEKTYPCPICEKVYLYRSRCTSHMERYHAVADVIDARVVCRLCDTAFDSIVELTLHQGIEHPMETLALSHGRRQQEECGECGAHVVDLQAHAEIHGAKRYECRECGKRFTRRPYLVAHELAHSGLMPHECRLCKRRFAKKSNYNAHMRSHELHRDEAGNYLPMLPRGGPCPLASRNVDTTADMCCGPDEPMTTVVHGNSRGCDTADLYMFCGGGHEIGAEQECLN